MKQHNYFREINETGNYVMLSTFTDRTAKKILEKPKELFLSLSPAVNFIFS